jgi:hemerythrin-like metal-binding protein
VSSVEDAIVSKQRWSAVYYAIVEARQFTHFHFNFEESLMRLYGYSEVDEHATAHRLILEKMKGIERSIMRADEVARLFMCLGSCLLDHIQHADRAYAHYILMGAKVIAPEESDVGSAEPMNGDRALGSTSSS